MTQTEECQNPNKRQNVKHTNEHEDMQVVATPWTPRSFTYA